MKSIMILRVSFKRTVQTFSKPFYLARPILSSFSFPSHQSTFLHREHKLRNGSMHFASSLPLRGHVHTYAHAHTPFDRIALHRIMINPELSMFPATSSFQFETISCATAVDLRRNRETRSLIPEIGNRKPAYPTFFAETDFASKVINYVEANLLFSDESRTFSLA